MNQNEPEITGHLSEGPIDYFDDVEPEQAAPATLERLTQMARQATELEKVIAADDVQLQEKRAELDKILGRLIPSIMEELGMMEFKLADGSLVSIKEDIRTSIKVDDRPAAYRWLETLGFDGIIKMKVQTDLKKGDQEIAGQIVKAIAALGREASVDRSIHPATLKSFVKERMAADSESADVPDDERLPLGLFGVFQFKEAKIKLPKAKK